MERSDQDTLLRVKKYLEAILTFSQYLSSSIQEDTNELYREVYNKLNPEHTV